MNPPFHSPLRKTIANGSPGYPFDNPIAALPPISVWPEKNGWRLSLWLIVDTARSAVEHKKFLSGDKVHEEIHNILLDYFTDPERTMLWHFGWAGIKSLPRAYTVEPEADARPAPRKVPAAAPRYAIGDDEDAGF